MRSYLTLAGRTAQKESTSTGSPAMMSRPPRTRKGNHPGMGVSKRQCDIRHGTRPATVPGASTMAFSNIGAKLTTYTS